VIELLASLLLAAPIPPPSANQQWTRVTTQRFTIISATGERNTRDLAHDLETLAAALLDLLPGTKQPPTRVIVFARHGEAQPYLDLLLNKEKSNATGAFVLQRGAATMLIDASRGRVADRTPYHELAHYLLAGAEQHPPLWLEEGIAEYYSNAQIHGGMIRVGLPVREHLARLTRPNVMPARDVFAVTRGSLHATDLVFYAESWAIVDWMLRTSRKDFGGLLRDVTAGTPIDAALRAHFNRDAAGMDAIIKGYIPPQYAMMMKVAAPLDVRADPTPVPYAEVVFELGRLLSFLDRAAADADRHFRLTLDANPNHAAALAGLARLRSREAKDDEASALFERAIAADPEDAAIQLMYAEALLRPEIGGGLAETTEHTAADVPRFRRARELAQNALAHGADETRSRGAIGTSYIVEDDPAPGIPDLERAHALFPQRTDYPMHLLSLYLRTGEQAKAAQLAAQLEKTLSAPLRAVMISVLLREDIRCINALIAAGDLDAAIAALRDLIATTKDGGTREQLAQQLARIEKR
jgi:tetratricopeptide (TPR) repeat protein